MKTLAIALLAALSLTTACATEDDDGYHTGGRGLRPGYKPDLDGSLPGPGQLERQRDPLSNGTEIVESVEIGAPELDGDRDEVDDGRLVWVVDVPSRGRTLTEIHELDQRSGLETIEILDENTGTRCCITTRYPAQQLAPNGLE